MVIRVKLFAMCRDAVGSDEIELTLPDGSGPERFWSELVSAYPMMARFQKTSRLAVNQAYSTPSLALKAGDEVCVIPPVSGG